MRKTEDIYRELTNVDIEEQRKLWDERGKGYYGEFLVFKTLFSDTILPGFCKILMNIHIPTQVGKTTEIDLLIIHETGLYVFEIKHFKGTIFGRTFDDIWIQYFRTAKNQTFRNPINQNQYHIEAIRNIYSNVPIYSFVVFTNEDCNLRVECDDPNITVCALRNMVYELCHVISRKSVIMDMNQINTIFANLKKYSPIDKKKVILSDEEIPFEQYIDRIIEDQKIALKHNMDNFQNQISQNNKVVKRVKIIASIICIVILMFCIFISGLISASCIKQVDEAKEEVNKAKEELKNFAQKFMHVEEFNNGEIILSNSLIEVTNVVMENSIDLVDTVVFSCTLNWIGEEYGIRLSEDTKYIVMLEDGTIQEYNLFNTSFQYFPLYQIGKGHYETFELPVCEFYDIDINNIVYIKLVDLSIWKYGVKYDLDLFTEYELELYSK